MPDSLDGNETQSRKVAKQLFSIWEEEQSLKQTRWWSGSVPAWIACVLSLGMLVWNAAVISGNVAENRRRIEMVETEQRRASNDDRQVVDRMARIEAKLDIVLEGK